MACGSDPMNWVRCTPTVIGSADGAYRVTKSLRFYPREKKQLPQYDAWGPEGDLKPDFVAGCTADALRREERPVPPELQMMIAGRTHIGAFDTADQAKAACAAHLRRRPAPVQEALL